LANGRVGHVGAMPGFLLINPRSGSGSPSADELERKARELGIETHLLAKGEDPGESARAAHAGPLGIAGGDGSLGAVAAVAIERDLPFVCVPFGTRNHFARDVGLDRDDPLAALAAFAGVERRVDVGRANGRVFLNNVSLGMYASLVRRREEHRRRGEALARIRAFGRAVRDWRPRFVLGGELVEARVILVANNEYRLDLFSLGARERLDGGILALYVAHGVLRHTWHERTGTAFEIGAEGAPRFPVAYDGEPALVEPPLRCTIEPRALRLLLPPG
jgi:diacylglycerol kinase family enzyme